MPAKWSSSLPPPRKHDLIVETRRTGTTAEVAKQFNTTPDNVRAHMRREAVYKLKPRGRQGPPDKLTKHDKRRIHAIILAHPLRVEADMRDILTSKGYKMGSDLLLKLRTEFGLRRGGLQRDSAAK